MDTMALKLKVNLKYYMKARIYLVLYILVVLSHSGGCGVGVGGVGGSVGMKFVY